MLPQNAQQLRPQIQQQQGQPGLPFMPPNPSFDHPPYFNNLDPSQAAKQMAALSAASHARIAANSRTPSSMPPAGGTSSGSYLGGIGPAVYSGAKHDLLPASVNGHANFGLPNNHGVPHTPNSAVNTSFLDPPMSQPATQPNSLKLRQQGFLNSLASVMAKRNTPLPPSLTGVPFPNYDPNTSPWSYIESTEVGSFRLAGQDVSLFKLWGLVMQNGGAQTVKANNGWPPICAEFSLPEEFPHAQTNSSTSVPLMLEQMYMAILYPFEDIYKKNVNEQHRKAQIARQMPMAQPGQMRPMVSSGVQPVPGQLQRGPMNLMGQPSVPAAHGTITSPNAPQFSSSVVHTPQTPQRPSSSALNPQMTLGALSQPNTQGGLGHAVESNILENDMQGIKRKLDLDEVDAKRARQKTDPLENNALLPSVNGTSVTPNQQHPPTNTGQARMRQPFRRKIEYVPLAREVDTYGGRDFKLIEHEWNTVPQRRPLRDINDWGTIDIEALRMSVRSRIPTELSYALTTFTILSTMRGQNPGSGFPIYQCSDFFDDVLDLLEEEAFGDAEDDGCKIDLDESSPIVAHRNLLNAIYDKEFEPFAALEYRPGSKNPSNGPTPRPGETILTIVNILRNLSVVADNWQFLSRHDRLIDTMLRLCTVRLVDGSPTPASPHLSLSDLVAIRKDTLYTLVNLAGFIILNPSSPLSPSIIRMSKRAFELVASYLVDPTEAVSPLATVQAIGMPPNASVRPPSLADAALEVFTRFSQADVNRQALAETIPKAHIWQLFEALVHRLPLTDLDFSIMTREAWLSYLEKTIMSLYSLSFLAPPSLKQRLKSDRKLRFKNVMFRLVHKFMMHPDFRMLFAICSRRAIEIMKVLDDEGDFFDNSETTTTVLSFGMGFGDTNDLVTENGTGLLGGHRDIAWDILMTPQVYQDEVMFKELESLTRVEC